MPKSPFIPKNYRPIVPGSELRMPRLAQAGKRFSSNGPEACILCFSVKDDIVPDYFFRDIDSKTIVHLHYDELGISWDFTFFQNVLKIHTHDRVMTPNAIYHRHPGISKSHVYFQKHAAFFEILDIWWGNLLGQKRDHYQNFSKAYQGMTSIRSSNAKTGQNVKYPRSFFLKGSFNLLKERFQASLIVKSSSNMRSKVVSEEVFEKWNMDNLRNLPTLFQENIEGTDIRVHICGEVVWSLQVEDKDCIDYRYASRGIVKYREIQLPEYLTEFCKSIAQMEQNKFIGIDLMKCGNRYFCLESNPGPGWSTYHHPSKKTFAKNVFKQLLRK